MVVCVLNEDDDDRTLDGRLCDESTVELEIAWVDVSCLVLTPTELVFAKTLEFEACVTVANVDVC